MIKHGITRDRFSRFFLLVFNPAETNHANVFSSKTEESPKMGAVTDGGLVTVVEITDSWMRLQSGGWVMMQSEAGYFAIAKPAKSHLTNEMRHRCTEFYKFYCPEKLHSLNTILAKRENSETALKKMWDLMQKRYGPWPPIGWSALQKYLLDIDESLVGFTTELLREGFDRKTIETRGVTQEAAEKLGIPGEMRRFLVPVVVSPACSEVSDVSSSRVKLVSVVVQKKKGGEMPFKIDAECILTQFDDEKLNAYYVSCRLAAINEKTILCQADASPQDFEDEEILTLTIAESDRLNLGTQQHVESLVSTPNSSSKSNRLYQLGDRVSFNTKEAGWVDGAEIESFASDGLYDIRIVTTGEILKDWREINLKPASVSWTREDITLLDHLTSLKEAEKPYDEALYADLKQRQDQYIEQGLKCMAASPKGVSQNLSPIPKKRFGWKKDKAKELFKKMKFAKKKQNEEFLAINTSNPNTRGASSQRVPLSFRPPNLLADSQGRQVQSILYGGSTWWWVVADEKIVAQPDEETTHPLDAMHLRAARFEARRRRKIGPMSLSVSIAPSNSSVVSEDVSSLSSESHSDELQLKSHELEARVVAGMGKGSDGSYRHLKELYLLAKEQIVAEGELLDDYQDRDHLEMREMFPLTRMLLRGSGVAPPSEAGEFLQTEDKPLEDAIDERTGFGEWCRVLESAKPQTSEEAIAEFVKYKSRHAVKFDFLNDDSDDLETQTGLSTASPPIPLLKFSGRAKDSPVHSLSLPGPASSLSVGRCSTSGSISPRSGMRNPRNTRSTPNKAKPKIQRSE
eukprot:TRINITY_DN13864_c0_g1_i1.p1 TRINITY_DN13864_c0_g1~~TRINITY_DN13864_c0_g1_i1.p1  ORF type:complete len:799 (+),score=117.76 TRINITY_DN13864_c0_g1_i1:54-2450(+)